MTIQLPSTGLRHAMASSVATAAGEGQAQVFVLFGFRQALSADGTRVVFKTWLMILDDGGLL